MAGWRDIDTNSHMGNTAYLDKAVDVRMMYFADCGFPMSEFVRLRLGPVVMRDEVDYYREFRLLDEMTVSFGLAGLSPDGSRMMLRNDILRDGKLAARVTTTAGWLDLANRKLVCPPAKVLQAMRNLGRSEDYKDLPNISSAQPATE
jgi:acyl-CoA thioester hydrolase